MSSRAKLAGPGLPLYASNVMLELMRALGGGMLAGPATDRKEIIRISCSCEFEPFGRASESWDLVWTLTLCRIRFHRRTADGWEPMAYPDPMTFKGIDDADVLKKALQFLRDVPKPQALELVVPPKGQLAANALDEDASS